MSTSRNIITAVPFTINFVAYRDKGDSGGHSLSHPSKASSIPLTGDPRADADILAFYKARQKLIREFK